MDVVNNEEVTLTDGNEVVIRLVDRLSGTDRLELITFTMNSANSAGVQFALGESVASKHRPRAASENFTMSVPLNTDGILKVKGSAEQKFTPTW